MSVLAHIEFPCLVLFVRRDPEVHTAAFDPAYIVPQSAVRQLTLQADEVPVWWSLHTNLDLHRLISIPLRPAPTERGDKRAPCHCAPGGRRDSLPDLCC